MKNSFLIFLLLAFFNSFSQTNSSDKDLLVKFSDKEIQNLKENNIEEYEYLKYCARNSFYLNPIPTEKMTSGQTRVGSIEIEDIKNINFYDLNIEIIQDDYQFFAIKGTDKMLVIKSKDHILKELRKK
ncbi:MAG: hypothetical protein H6587_08340 [Flavobacteriales bacterium]|nr:hypothetical protein [Flavobacteriales bacterium]MCB9364563.1 hypothetical protein [Flavobacteriales bacterium]